jgi:periplasmic protein CpxP/Spy
MSYTLSTLRARLKPVLLASLLAVGASAAFAQAAPPAAPGATQAQPQAHRGMRHDQRDPAKMQQHMAKREADLKAKLKIEPSQEAAWTSFTTAMKPPADWAARRDTMRAEMQKLTTPERIDRMKAMRAQRDAEMDKRAQATKDFYAVLTPDQKKTFDSRAMMGRGGEHRGSRHGGRHGGMHGATEGHGSMHGQMEGHQGGHMGGKMGGQGQAHEHGKS